MINKIRYVVFSFVLTAFSGLSAQNDTTFIANGNPIIQYKYTADPGAMVQDVYKRQVRDNCDVQLRYIFPFIFPVRGISYLQRIISRRDVYKRQGYIPKELLFLWLPSGFHRK